MSSSDGNDIVITQPVHDLYLSLLISLVNNEDDLLTSMSVTLTTPGGLVSGDLVSRETWKNLWTEMILTKGSASAGSWGSFPDVVDQLTKEVKEESDDDADSEDVPYFVHLKDVVLLGAGGSPIRFPFWRGRLDSVTGWSLGKLTD